MWGVIKNKKSHLYRINGVEDHVHILSSLHPTVTLADFIKDIKVSSSKWIKEDGVFPGFTGWQDGYGAFTHSWPEKGALIEYVKDQKNHHATVSFRDEYRRLLEEAGIKFDERFLL
jgi:REP element-mobilizing transposase RayT